MCYEVRTVGDRVSRAVEKVIDFVPSEAAGVANARARPRNVLGGAIMHN